MKWLPLLLSCWATLTFAQRNQVFKVVPTPIEQGQEATIYYNPALNGISADTEVKGSLYFFTDFKWQGFDLPLIKTDSGYTAKAIVPAGTSMLAVRYALGDSIDRGRRFPYATTISTSKGETVDGGLTEWGLLRSRDLEGHISPLVSEVSLIEPKTLIKLWISNEYQKPLVRRNLFVQIANGIRSYFPKEKADSILSKGALELASAKDVTEKELIGIEKVYRTIMNNEAKADSFKTTILLKYPKGLRYRLQLINEIRLEQNNDQKLIRWDNFINESPVASFPFSDYRDPILGEKTSFDQFYVSLIDLSIQKHDLNKLAALVEVCPIELINELYTRYVISATWNFKGKIKDREILPLSVAFNRILLSRIAAASPNDRSLFAPTEWKKEQMNFNAEVWAYHIKLLYKHSKYGDALVFSDQVKNHIGFKNIDFNTVYVKLMYHFRQDQIARTYTLMAIKAGKAAPEIIDLLKDDQRKTKKRKSQAL